MIGVSVDAEIAQGVANVISAGAGLLLMMFYGEDKPQQQNG